jgi:hypothetical protein
MTTDDDGCMIKNTRVYVACVCRVCEVEYVTSVERDVDVARWKEAVSRGDSSFRAPTRWRARAREDARWRSSWAIVK